MYTVEPATLNIFLIEGGFGIDPRHPPKALREQWVDIAHRFSESLERWLEDQTFPSLPPKRLPWRTRLMALVLNELKDTQIR